MARKNGNIRIYAFAFILFACATGYLCYTGFSENSVYFLNVSEAKAANANIGHARLFGLVAESGLDRRITGASFNLLDKDNSESFIPVVYKGNVPDAFKAGAEVIVEGALNGDGNFIANVLMTKCPSKYKKENRGN